MAIITISRGTYSGGKALAESIAQKLGYHCVAAEVLGEAAEGYDMDLHELEHAIRDKPGMFERSGKDRLRALAYITAALCNHIKDEKVVYHGNAGHFLLKDVPHVFRVRLIADMEYRIAAVTKERDLSRSDAIKFIQRADEARVKWTQFLFHANPLDCSMYDMVINLERTSLSGACELVCRAASEERFQATSASQKALEDLCLQSRIRARLASDAGVDGAGVQAQANAGVVMLNGAAVSRNKERIKQLLMQESGVTKVLIQQ